MRPRAIIPVLLVALALPTAAGAATSAQTTTTTRTRVSSTGKRTTTTTITRHVRTTTKTVAPTPAVAATPEGGTLGPAVCKQDATELDQFLNNTKPCPRRTATAADPQALIAQVERQEFEAHIAETAAALWPGAGQFWPLTTWPSMGTIRP